MYSFIHYFRKNFFFLAIVTCNNFYMHTYFQVECCTVEQMVLLGKIYHGCGNY